MPTFAERHGFRTAKALQFESMDADLRVGLWNAISGTLFAPASFDYIEHGMARNAAAAALEEFTPKLWSEYYKLPIDEISGYWSQNHDFIRDRFFSDEWYDVYGFIEFIISEFPDSVSVNELKDTVNVVLEREASAYRVIGSQVVAITSAEEICEIEEALSSSQSVGLKGVNTHLLATLRLLSDRVHPDFRNAIKEAISAIESLCRIISGTNDTLGQCLKALEKKVMIHTALKGAFSQLYGWTSDSNGIRHSLMTEQTLEFEDAKFMLVSCAAFVNYLIAKANRSGIALE